MSLSKPTQISEKVFDALENALSANGIGRSFLAEYLRRNQAAETQRLLKAVQHLEEYMRSRQFPSEFDSVRLNLFEMNEAIARTKKEIARLKTDNTTGDHFTAASNELDAIVSSTENATQAILEAAEAIQEAAWSLRENPQDVAQCDAIDEKATEIFMSCSFQDLTGQRTQKVVQVLHYLEERLDRMISIWGVEGYELEEDDDTDQGVKSMDKRPDAHLLNGPQMEGEGVNQSDVDALFDTFSSVAPEEDEEAQEPAETAEVEPETLEDAPAEEQIFAGVEAAAEEQQETEGNNASEGANIIPLAQSEPQLDEDLDLFEADSEAEKGAEEPAPLRKSNSDPLERLSTGERLALFS
ncbi:protein phosphatase CheZ [Pseudovibrio exalbescens]|uniref:protein phosphatase CheZ n=1 Tax=Pseudovibrio exalbescens TaxID=197461 RepID=UPI002366F76D|nr:protein phosphatase CheZ [Pseudovibrio exalbescens]MDD7910402.1 protein phosphatase CheZ [Pseudovibrio exalbescens]